jgi:hypothetical protein
MNWIKKIFAQKAKPASKQKPAPINPVAFGFTQRYTGIDDYEKDGFILYKSDIRGTWVFDKRKKTAPGIIARFDSPLLEDDLNYMLAYIERMAQTTEGC